MVPCVTNLYKEVIQILSEHSQSHKGVYSQHVNKCEIRIYDLLQQWEFKEDLNHREDEDVTQRWYVVCHKKQHTEQVLIFSEPRGFTLSKKWNKAPFLCSCRQCVTGWFVFLCFSMQVLCCSVLIVRQHVCFLSGNDPDQDQDMYINTHSCTPSYTECMHTNA